MVWAALSVVVGLFGIKTISDLDSKMDRSVESKYEEYVGKGGDLLEKYRKQYSAAIEKQREFERENKGYLEKLDSLKLLEIATEGFDLEGKLIRLLVEVEQRKAAKGLSSLLTNPQGDDPFRGSVLEDTWRAKAIAVLSLVQRELDGGRRISAADVFNAAQTARELQAFELTVALAAKAEEMSASPAYKAVGLHAKLRLATDPSEARGYVQELFELVRNLSHEDPHVVIAEAWNAAVQSDDFRGLIEAIEDLEKDRRAKQTPPLAAAQPAPIPSYVYVIKARALLKEAAPGCQTAAEAALENADLLLSEESTETEWASDTVEEGQQVKGMLDRSKELRIPDPEEEPASAAGIDGSDGLDLGMLERLVASTISRTEIEEAVTPSGEHVEVGDRIRVRKPEDLSQGPGWIPEMDGLATGHLTVLEILDLGEFEGVRVEENDKTWDVRWIVSVEGGG